MMKKAIVIMLLASLLLPVAASAKLNADLFDCAKSALSYISYGEYAKALKALGLKSDKAAAKKLKSAVEDHLPTALYGEAQTDVALCYRTAKGYRLCVPVEDPSVGAVECFIALSKDGESIGGYTMAAWTDCVAEAGKSKEVTWQSKPQPKEPMIVAD